MRIFRGAGQIHVFKGAAMEKSVKSTAMLKEHLKVESVTFWQNVVF